MIKIGDKVRFHKNWLRSTFQFTGDVPRAQGFVVNIDGIVATVEWDCLSPSRVLVKNLTRVGVS